jgi:nucleolar protein 14
MKREITRDAAFMGEEKRKEKERAKNARDKTQKRAIAFLEQQEADAKSGGQAGMNPHLKQKRAAK